MQALIRNIQNENTKEVLSALQGELSSPETAQRLNEYRDDEQNTLLHLVAQKKSMEEVALLLVEGFNMDPISLFNSKNQNVLDVTENARLRGMMRAIHEIQLMKKQIFEGFNPSPNNQSNDSVRTDEQLVNKNVDILMDLINKDANGH
jgi:hypothetical protein